MAIPKLPAYPSELTKSNWDKTAGILAKISNPQKLKVISDGISHCEKQFKTLDPKILASLDAADTLPDAQKAAGAIAPKVKGMAGMVANLRKFAPEAKRIADELAKGTTTKGTAKTVAAVSTKAMEYAKALEAFASAIDVACEAVTKIKSPTFQEAMGNGKLKAALKEWTVKDQRAVEVFNFIDFFDAGIKPENATVAFNTFIAEGSRYQVNTGNAVTGGLTAIYAKLKDKKDPKEQVQIWKDNWSTAEKLFKKADSDNRFVTLATDMFPRFVLSKYLWAVVAP